MVWTKLNLPMFLLTTFWSGQIVYFDKDILIKVHNLSASYQDHFNLATLRAAVNVQKYKKTRETICQTSVWSDKLLSLRRRIVRSLNPSWKFICKLCKMDDFIYWVGSDFEEWSVCSRVFIAILKVTTRENKNTYCLF